MERERLAASIVPFRPDPFEGRALIACWPEGYGKGVSKPYQEGKDLEEATIEKRKRKRDRKEHTYRTTSLDPLPEGVPDDSEEHAETEQIEQEP